MKKIIVCVLTVLLFTSGSAFAADVTLTPDSTKAPNGAVLDATGAASVAGFMKFSKGVYAGAYLASGTGYTLTTAHTQGSKYYGTGYDATALYAKDAGGTVAATLAAPTSSVTATAFADWTKL